MVNYPLALWNLSNLWHSAGPLLIPLTATAVLVWFWILGLHRHLNQRNSLALQCEKDITQWRGTPQLPPPRSAFIDLNWISRSSPAQRRRHFESLTLHELTPVDRELIWLKCLVQLGPFLGLLGTILGIMACMRLSPGQSPSALLGTNIAQALITTGAGISAALPGVIALPLLHRRRRALAERIRDLEQQTANLPFSEVNL